MEHLIKHYRNNGYLDNKGRIVMTLVDENVFRTKDTVNDRINQIVSAKEYYELYRRRKNNLPWKLISTNIPKERY